MLVFILFLKRKTHNEPLQVRLKGFFCFRALTVSCYDPNAQAQNSPANKKSLPFIIFIECTQLNNKHGRKHFPLLAKTYFDYSTEAKERSGV